MSRTWMAAALLACASAFAIAFVAASPGSDRAPKEADRANEQVEHDGDTAARVRPVALAHQVRNLHPAAVPASWHRSRLPDSPAVLAYPPRWKQIGGDAGTRTAVLHSGGRIVGYLNATPQGGGETTANWLAFRPAHNRDEGNTSVEPLAGSRGQSFLNGRGSCLVDNYTTAAGAHFRELACIVAGTRATTVVVGSAHPSDWPRMAPVLRRAVAGFLT